MFIYIYIYIYIYIILDSQKERERGEGEKRFNVKLLIFDHCYLVFCDIFVAIFGNIDQRRWRITMRIHARSDSSCPFCSFILAAHNLL